MKAFLNEVGYQKQYQHQDTPFLFTVPRAFCLHVCCQPMSSVVTAAMLILEQIQIWLANNVCLRHLQPIQ